jgi:hypothetical protein
LLFYIGDEAVAVIKNKVEKWWHGAFAGFS